MMTETMIRAEEMLGRLGRLEEEARLQEVLALRQGGEGNRDVHEVRGHIEALQKVRAALTALQDPTQKEVEAHLVQANARVKLFGVIPMLAPLDRPPDLIFGAKETIKPEEFKINGLATISTAPTIVQTFRGTVLEILKRVAAHFEEEKRLERLNTAPDLTWMNCPKSLPPTF